MEKKLHPIESNIRRRNPQQNSIPFESFSVIYYEHLLFVFSDMCSSSDLRCDLLLLDALICTTDEMHQSG